MSKQNNRILVVYVCLSSKLLKLILCAGAVLCRATRAGRCRCTGRWRGTSNRPWPAPTMADRPRPDSNSRPQPHRTMPASNIQTTPPNLITQVLMGRLILLKCKLYLFVSTFKMKGNHECIFLYIFVGRLLMKVKLIHLPSPIYLTTCPYNALEYPFNYFS